MTAQAPSNEVEFSRFVDCGKLPSGGKNIKIEADQKERQALIERLAIDKLDSLVGEFSLTPRKKGRITLSGRITASIGQTCVVSLKPMVSALDITIERTYSLKPESDRKDHGEPDEDGYLSGGRQTKDLPEPPDLLENGGIDLGEVASEELAVEIDPFPRLPGVEMKASPDLSGVEQADQKKNPFAVLESLKKKLE